MDSPFDNIGHPIPEFRKTNAHQLLRSFGLSTTDTFSCVTIISEQLERDKPHEAMEYARKYVDLTGAYRLFAELLASE